MLAELLKNPLGIAALAPARREPIRARPGGAPRDLPPRREVRARRRRRLAGGVRGRVHGLVGERRGAAAKLRALDAAASDRRRPLPEQLVCPLADSTPTRRSSSPPTRPARSSPTRRTAPTRRGRVAALDAARSRRGAKVLGPATAWRRSAPWHRERPRHEPARVRRSRRLGPRALLAGPPVLVVARTAPARRPRRRRAQQGGSSRSSDETADQTALFEAGERHKSRTPSCRATRAASGATRACSTSTCSAGRTTTPTTPAAKAAMDMALGAQPGFYFARLRLAILLAEAKDHDAAPTPSSAGARRRPGPARGARGPDALRPRAQGLGPGARDCSRPASTATPTTSRVRQARVRAPPAQGRGVGAEGDRDALGPRPRRPLSTASCRRRASPRRATSTGGRAPRVDRPRAARHLDVPDAARAASTRRRRTGTRLRTTLERMVPHLEDACARTSSPMIEELKKGPPPSLGRRARDAASRTLA